MATLRWLATLAVLCSFTGVACTQLCAKCEMMENSALVLGFDIGGEVELKQASSSVDLEIKVRVTGFNTTDTDMEHGFHIHEFSDVSNGCNSMGSHFNPTNKDHGGPTDSDRHVGDLGNILIRADGSVNTDFSDSVASLFGDNTVINKSMVIHERHDNFTAQPTGDAGGRWACCVILEDECSTASSNKPLALIAGLLAVIAHVCRS